MEHTGADDLALLNLDVRESAPLFRSLVANIPGAVYRCSTEEGWPMYFISSAVETITGYPASDFVQSRVRTFSSIIHPDDLPHVEQANEDGIAAHRPFEIEYRIICADGSIGWVYEKGQGVYDANGVVRWLDGAIFDISTRKQAETRLREAATQAAVITAQTALIAELSTPLMPISDDVLVMPLVGAIDAARAQQILDTLLHGVAGGDTTTVIVDITGIAVVDTHVARMLLDAAAGARLLGTVVVLTGIRPEVAQTLVGLGVELGQLVTFSTLQRGVAWALRQQMTVPVR